MIEIRSVTKCYDDIKAVDNISVTIKENTVFGLIGTNGAGKSTALRMAAGVLRPDEGEITIDGIPVFDNMEAKKNIYFIADEPYFFANSNAVDMQKYLCSVYPEFAVEDFYNYLVNFGLDKKRKIGTYSKGMRKQLALICGVCSGTKYLLCDETFDGLDPVMRLTFKRAISKMIEEKEMTVIISSHNLRELEDICDTFGILEDNTIRTAGYVDETKENIHKIQLAFKEEKREDDFKALDLLSMHVQSRVVNLVVKGDIEKIKNYLNTMDPLMMEVLNVNLEEVFIYEMEKKGYGVYDE